MIAWVLNLDADHELRKPLGYLPNKGVRARVAQMRERLRDLVLPGDCIVGDAPIDGACVGLAWCPTPTALLQFERAGVQPAAAPPFEVVRRVNHRRFSVDMGPTLPGCRWIEDEGTLRAEVAKGSPSGRWVMKRPYSIAGSGRRVLRDGVLAPHDAPWVTATLKEGGLVLEPWVQKEGELVVHGYVHREGGARIGDPCIQTVDEHGHWLDTFRGDIAAEEVRAMVDCATGVASALDAAGYFGPFGVDAFRYRDGETVKLNARSEINARYTMGWAIGMGGERPDRAPR